MAFGLRLAVIAFSVKCLTGVIDGQDFETTIQSALLAGGIFWGLGLILGELARHVIEEHVRAEFEETTKTTSAKEATTTTD
ncbi:MAG: hypothetical protein KDA84_00370 [Planctomycetaceae bacterium]|nr:hypothetical protein [Planctomycetaceae bacterium]